MKALEALYNTIIIVGILVVIVAATMTFSHLVVTNFGMIGMAGGVVFIVFAVVFLVMYFDTSE